MLTLSEVTHKRLKRANQTKVQSKQRLTREGGLELSDRLEIEKFNGGENKDGARVDVQRFLAEVDSLEWMK